MKKLPLNLVYLKYFCDAVKHGSISLSAKASRVSQSAVSQGIAKLEEGLGYLLIEHQPNRFKTTAEGDLLFEGSKTIFEAIQSVEESLAIEGQGRVEFACTHSFALAQLPLHLKKIGKSHPQWEIRFKLGHTDVIKEWVKKGVIDFGIVLDNEDFSGFECEEIHSGEYRLYVSKSCKHPEKLPFLLSEERTETNLLKKSYRKRFKKELAVLMEISSWEVIARLTEEGLGVGFFPDYVAEGRHTHLKLYPLPIDPISYKIYALFSKGSKKLSLAREFFG